jgi:(p)ppGpp synthase/HD superfamily hydrolase
MFTSRINEAIKLASHLHRNQIRKDELNTPYVSHLFSVAMILSSATDDEDIIIAGLMHDSLEDVPRYTYDMLVSDCGERVALTVKHVTEPLDANKMDNEQLPWLTRKEEYIKNLQAGRVESAMVSAADKIHNTESFLTDIRLSGDVFLSKFSSSLRNKLWFHEQVFLIVEEKLGGNNVLVERLKMCTEEFRKLCEAQESLVVS